MLQMMNMIMITRLTQMKNFMGMLVFDFTQIMLTMQVKEKKK